MTLPRSFMVDTSEETSDITDDWSSSTAEGTGVEASSTLSSGGRQSIET